MVQIPTVLILGAGASQHLRYPLGRELVSEMCRDYAEAFKNCKWPSDEVERFIEHLGGSDPDSPDEFLERNPEFLDIGRYLIAWTLKRCEKPDALRPPNDTGWYRRLSQRICDKDVSEIESGRLSIITFNYDRSLECYLHKNFRYRFKIPDEEALAAVRKLNILHMHGTLGTYPEYPYKPPDTFEETLNAASDIKIIHEFNDSDDGFCTEEFRRANELLRAAERIYFLGFGFHEANLRRFRFFEATNLEGKTINTCCIFGGRQLFDSLLTRVARFGLQQTHLNRGSSWQCNSFFECVATLD